MLVSDLLKSLHLSLVVVYLLMEWVPTFPILIFIKSGFRNILFRMVLWAKPLMPFTFLTFSFLYHYPLMYPSQKETHTPAPLPSNNRLQINLQCNKFAVGWNNDTNNDLFWKVSFSFYVFGRNKMTSKFKRKTQVFPNEIQPHMTSVINISNHVVLQFDDIYNYTLTLDISALLHHTNHLIILFCL